MKNKKLLGLGIILLNFTFLKAQNYNSIGINVPETSSNYSPKVFQPIKFSDNSNSMFNQKNYIKKRNYFKKEKKDINLNNFSRKVIYNGKPIVIKIAYGEPIQIVFPAFIEKLEYLKGKGGIEIITNGFRNGEQSLTVLKKVDLPGINYAYVNLLGKRIPIVFMSAKPKDADHIVYINLIDKQLAKKNRKQIPIQPKIYKVMKYNNLSYKTNIKSVMMIINILQGKAENYYQKIPLKPLKKEKKSFFSFFKSNEPSKEKYIETLFTSLFGKNNNQFIQAYLGNLIEPVALYKDSYIVWISNKKKKNLDIYGLVTKWCNLNKNTVKQITIDDVKLVYGKNLLAAYHPFKKLAPGECGLVVGVFYTLKNKNENNNQMNLLKSTMNNY